MPQINPRAVELALKIRASANGYMVYMKELEALWSDVKARYPLITFDSRFDNMTGPGWWPILEDLFEKLSTLIQDDGSIHITQIKEKFGGLRIYVGTSDDVRASVQQLIAEAARQANKTCYFCGKPAELRTERAWVATLCDEHNK